MHPSAITAFIVQPPPLTDSTKDAAKKIIADTLAANLAGATSEVLTPLAAFIDNAAPLAVARTHAVFGTFLRAPADVAALCNGTLSAALEFDDVLSMMPGHPSAVVVSALCASCALQTCSGWDFVEAYAVGIEVGARIAQAITLDHYKRGYHATGTLCVFSAVAALARLERLDADKIDAAFGIAASMASGLQANFGTMVKPLHSGWAARNAWTAVQLARAGLTANPDVFAAVGGFFDAYGGSNSGFAQVQGLAQPWILDDPGITLKLFPCCYASHRAMDAAIAIRQALRMTAADVKRVHCLVPPGGLIPLKFPRPANRFESLFSLPYAVAVTLLDGYPRLAAFTQARVHAPDVAALLDRIHVEESPLCVADDPDYARQSYGSRGEVRLEIETMDGRHAARTVRIAPGHPARPVSWTQMAAKFTDAAQMAGLARETITAALGLFRTLDVLPRAHTVFDLLAPTHSPSG